MITNFKERHKVPKPKYKNGDYILLDEKEEHGWTVYLSAKILNVLPYYDQVCYKLLTIIKKTGKELILRSVVEDAIDRKLTSKEIEEFEIIIDASKYNL